MNGSFYAAVTGASGQQTKMDVVANNMANINTAGYKSQSAVFSSLVQKKLSDSVSGLETVRTGTGAAVKKIGTEFTPAGYTQTDNENDYAIVGKGFFMLQNPVSGDTTFTRDGSFSLSQRGGDFYLASSDGKLVLDKAGRYIRMEEGTNPDIGIFTFEVEAGLKNIGKNEYEATPVNGEPVLSESSSLQQGALEISGVDLAAEMAKAMEAQKAYSLALKMIQTSDDVAGTINTLR
ncbi:flagellar hook-basal body protein [Parasporobacterium paucivorans]|uniref:Flagellar basal-body rod protein FlgG n=1 Tax=Parasporobacterium paucivorans DSM 15970 TaxID=1122934 RepID=A0A1M6IA22_9FIRM|nr:flagellar hook-basal body complex protein [Parasporobacterium paucivorans]SHJ31290.1 flagellar basal-body rod protein FlgG [Parasporobacterium paucivorans DSM 15970]